MLTEEQIRKASEDDYMNDDQLEFFRQLLLRTRAEVIERQSASRTELKDSENVADLADRATLEEEHWLDLRLREREATLIRKIEESLKRISAGEYGYCEETGDPIGIPRLLARPTATFSIDSKSHSERIEAQYRDQ